MQQRIVLLTAFLLLVLAQQPCVVVGNTSEETQTLHVIVDPSRTGTEIREDFVGLSFEKEILTQPGIFTPQNRILRTLFENLGLGNVRIGAASVEQSAWTRQHRTQSTGDKTVTADDLDRFYGFIKPTGWSVVHAVNLRNSSPAIAADEAEYAASKGGNSILAFEIGNEPDLGPVGPSEQYEVGDYIKSFNSFADAIRARVPGARFVGPGATTFGRSDNLNFLTRGIDEWTVPFANIEGKDIVQLTQHIYVVGKPEYTAPEDDYAATIPNLLNSATRERYIGILDKLEKASEKSGVPYRINEANSCYNGGQPGVSDTFASALWGADFLFTLATYGASGVNLQAGTQRPYTPIETQEADQPAARPLYYGLLFFHALGTGRLMKTTVDARDLEFSSYAILAKDGSISVALINREASKHVTAQVDVTEYFDTGKVLRLEAPSLSSTSGVRFGGGAVGQDGTWAPISKEVVSREGRTFSIQVPPASAALIRFDVLPCRWQNCPKKR
jgi:hypothetical protein